MKSSLLFSGHMIDKPGRINARFPPAKETIVKQQIRKFLLKEKERVKGDIKATASGACGGDILFHELCDGLEIKSEIYLGLPVDEFKKTSVSFAGKTWEMRFEKLIKKLPIHILPPAKYATKSENIWEQTNLWMLDIASEGSKKNLTLLALWNHKSTDRSGGTQHMIDLGKKQGAKVDIISIDKL